MRLARLLILLLALLIKVSSSMSPSECEEEEASLAPLIFEIIQYLFGGITLIVNLFGLVILLFFGKENMGTFRWYLVVYHTFGALIDLLLALLICPLPMLPHFKVQFLGIFRKIGVPAAVQIMVLLTVSGGHIVSLIVMFYARMKLLRAGGFMQGISKRLFIGVMLFLAVGTSWLFIYPKFDIIDSADEKNCTGTWLVISDEKWFLVAWNIRLFVYSSVMLPIVYRIGHFLTTTTECRSTNNKRSLPIFLIGVGVQVIYPTILTLLPTLIYIGFGQKDIGHFPNMIITFAASVQGAISTIAMLTTITPFRNLLKRIDCSGKQRLQ